MFHNSTYVTLFSYSMVSQVIHPKTDSKNNLLFLFSIARFFLLSFVWLIFYSELFASVCSVFCEQASSPCWYRASPVKKSRCGSRRAFIDKCVLRQCERQHGTRLECIRLKINCTSLGVRGLDKQSLDELLGCKWKI